MQAIERWSQFELTVKGPSSGNPFVDVTFAAQFRFKNRAVTVDGFYDGEGKYMVRFMPDQEGEWQFTTIGNLPELDGQNGSFQCIPATGDNHGPVEVHEVYNFRYADGKPYRQMGTTAYVWNHQNVELQNTTLETLANSPFNKLRMLVFPKHYLYNFHEPIFHAYEGNVTDGWDFRRFNPEFFQQLDRQIISLQKLGIEADLILFHSYDRWGFAQMDAESDDFYLKYMLARYSSFRNIWWSMANEYDLMYNKSMHDWDRYLRITQENDPYQHPRSIHNAYGFYDHGKAWVTHCSIQHWDLVKVTEWRETYRKPIVIDECCYEGNLHPTWGNITGQDMARRFWEGTIRGGHVGHGETYLGDTDIIYWSHGGKLIGSSPERIAFLLRILEEGPDEGVKPVRVNTGIPCLGYNKEYYLAYLGDRQPAYDELDFLEEGTEYLVDVIDTWDMTVTRAEGTYIRGKRVKLPTKQYMAVRAIKA